MLSLQWALRHSASSLARTSAHRHNFARCMSSVAPPTPPSTPSAQVDLSVEAARHAKGTIDVVVPTPTRPVKIKYRPVRVEPPKTDGPRDNEEPKTDDEDQPQAPPAADTWFTFVRRHLMTLGFSMLISTQLGVVFTWSNEASRLIGIDGEFDLYMGMLDRIAHSRSTMPLEIPQPGHCGQPCELASSLTRVTSLTLLSSFSTAAEELFSEKSDLVEMVCDRLCRASSYNGTHSANVLSVSRVNTHGTFIFSSCLSMRQRHTRRDAAPHCQA
jgi:hypothetical protein